MAKNAISHHKSRPANPPGVGITMRFRKDGTASAPQWPTNVITKLSSASSARNNGKALLGLANALVDWRYAPPATFSLKDCGDREHLFFLPRTPYDLDTDWKAFVGMGYWNHRRRISKQVKPLGVAPRIEVMHDGAIDCPRALAVAEGRNRRSRAEQNRKSLHLRQEFGT